MTTAQLTAREESLDLVLGTTPANVTTSGEKARQDQREGVKAILARHSGENYADARTKITAEMANDPANAGLYVSARNVLNHEFSKINTNGTASANDFTLPAIQYADAKPHASPTKPAEPHTTKPTAPALASAHPSHPKPHHHAPAVEHIDPEIQLALEKLGHSTGKGNTQRFHLQASHEDNLKAMDGISGPATRDALAAFKEHHPELKNAPKEQLFASIKTAADTSPTILTASTSALPPLTVPQLPSLSKSILFNPEIIKLDDYLPTKSEAALKLDGPGNTGDQPLGTIPKLNLGTAATNADSGNKNPTSIQVTTTPTVAKGALR